MNIGSFVARSEREKAAQERAKRARRDATQLLQAAKLGSGGKAPGGTKPKAQEKPKYDAMTMTLSTLLDMKPEEIIKARSARSRQASQAAGKPKGNARPSIPDARTAYVNARKGLTHAEQQELDRRIYREKMKHGGKMTADIVNRAKAGWQGERMVKDLFAGTAIGTLLERREAFERVREKVPKEHHDLFDRMIAVQGARQKAKQPWDRPEVIARAISNPENRKLMEEDYNRWKTVVGPPPKTLWEAIRRNNSFFQENLSSKFERWAKDVGDFSNNVTTMGIKGAEKWKAGDYAGALWPYDLQIEILPENREHNRKVLEQMGKDQKQYEKSHPYHYAVTRAVGGIPAGVPGTAAFGAALAEDLAAGNTDKAKKSLERMGSEMFRSVNAFEPGLSGPEKVERTLNFMAMFLPSPGKFFRVKAPRPVHVSPNLPEPEPPAMKPRTEAGPVQPEHVGVPGVGLVRAEMHPSTRGGRGNPPPSSSRATKHIKGADPAPSFVAPSGRGPSSQGVRVYERPGQYEVGERTRESVPGRGPEPTTPHRDVGARSSRPGRADGEAAQRARRGLVGTEPEFPEGSIREKGSRIDRTPGEGGHAGGERAGKPNAENLQRMREEVRKALTDEAMSRVEPGASRKARLRTLRQVEAEFGDLMSRSVGDRERMRAAASDTPMGEAVRRQGRVDLHINGMRKDAVLSRAPAAAMRLAMRGVRAALEEEVAARAGRGASPARVASVRAEVKAEFRAATKLPVGDGRRTRVAERDSGLGKAVRLQERAESVVDRQIAALRRKAGLAVHEGALSPASRGRHLSLRDITVFADGRPVARVRNWVEAQRAAFDALREKPEIQLRMDAVESRGGIKHRIEVSHHQVLEDLKGRSKKASHTELAELAEGKPKILSDQPDLDRIGMPLNQYEASIQDSKLECSACFDEQGQMVGIPRKGTPGAVGLPKGIADFDGLTIVHNHPRGWPISISDVASAMRRNFGVMRVLRGKGEVDVLVRPAQGWPRTAEEAWEIRIRYGNQVLDLIDQSMQELAAAGIEISPGKSEKIRMYWNKVKLMEMLEELGLSIQGDKLD